MLDQATYPETAHSIGAECTSTAVSCGLKVKLQFFLCIMWFISILKLFQLLAVIKNLAETSDVRPDLARAGAIQMLCRVLNNLMSPSIVTSVHSSFKSQASTMVIAVSSVANSASGLHSSITEAAKIAVAALFSLCRLDYVRCETAVKAGIVQNLMIVARHLPSLRQLVVTLLCDFAHASSYCRQILLKERVMPLLWDQVFGELPYWRHLALESISVVLKVISCQQVFWFAFVLTFLSRLMLMAKLMHLLLMKYCKKRESSDCALFLHLHHLMMLNVCLENFWRWQSLQVLLLSGSLHHLLLLMLHSSSYKDLKHLCA
jgi:hypothetical protein